jgi:hypothetical protein
VEIEASRRDNVPPRVHSPTSTRRDKQAKNTDPLRTKWVRYSLEVRQLPLITRSQR